MCAHPNLKHTGNTVKRKCKSSPMGYVLRPTFHCPDCGWTGTASDLKRKPKG